MIKTIVTIQLTLTGPILTQSSSPGSWGLDCVVARNAEGLFYLPGTLLTGKLLQAWQELKNAIDDKTKFCPEFEKWLGECSKNDFPKTKQLFFSDLVCQHNDSDQTNTANRIKIDAQRGSVEKNQLAVIESPFFSGSDYLFTGELHFFAADEEVENIVRHVKAGLYWTDSYGALRTVGFGRVKNVVCSVVSYALEHPAEQTPINNGIIGIVIKPRYPFCITGKPVADNLFESLDIIPGNALLGAIATTWNQLCGQSGGKIDDSLKDVLRPTLKKYFSSIRISHALPSEHIGVRPVTLPLSLVNVPINKRLYDVILLDKPCLINGETPAFAIDWKDDANSDFGWTKVTKELRTRTAIDPNTLRSADQDLFSYEQCVPKSLNWNASIDLSRIPEADRGDVISELQSLLSLGIAALSKTKTPATIEWLKLPIEATTISDTKPINNKQWIITLQTDTLLGAPVDLNESSGHKDLEAMYQQAWAALSDNKLQLVRYFARQRLSGGNYRHAVFRKNSDYQPWLLTEAGSVFLLQSTVDVSTEVCQMLIEDWLAHGLPIKEQRQLEFYGITKEIGAQWQSCPFIPQNGYGEIAVNLQWDTITQLKPDAKQTDQPLYLFKG